MKKTKRYNINKGNCVYGDVVHKFMKRPITILIILLSVVIILLLVDIFTGIWYYNRLYLKFDPANFNNIITPIAGLIGVIIFSLALFTSINQNKIILSQNLRPFYEKQIEKYIIYIQNVKIPMNPSLKEYGEANGLNYVRIFSKILIDVLNDKDFKADLTDFRDGKKYKRDYFYKRSYHDKAYFISSIVYCLNDVFFIYDELKNIVDDLINSKLTNDDKKILLKIINKEILSGYISFWDFIINRPKLYPELPILVFEGEIDFKSLHDSDFKKYYDWFQTLKLKTK